MSGKKGIDLISELVANRFSYHKIEKDLGLANGCLKKIVDGKLKLSDENYRKIQGYFIQNLLKSNPDPGIATKLERLESLTERVADLEAENARLKSRIQELLSVAVVPNSAISVPSPQEAIDNDLILDQIKAIQAEKCPKERDTPLGRGVFKMEQNKRIQELKLKLK